MKRAIALLVCCLISCVAIAAPSADDIKTIKARFAEEKLRNASVEMGDDGRLKLTGQFRDRAAVQLAFALAQQVVGVRWVAPTTPENVRYPGTEVIKAGILSALSRSSPKQTVGPSVRYALVVGVSRFADDKIPPIQNAADDAKAMFNFLGEKGFHRDNAVLLLDSDATKANVENAMRSIESRIRPNDTVVMYFSTHGNKPNDLGNVPIILYDTRVDMVRRWVDPKSTLVDDDIKHFVETVSPARVMIVLDVCYSGAAFAKIPGVLASTSKDLFVEESQYSTGVDQKSLNYLAGSGKSQDKILIAASGPGERSWNSPALRHGYFTYYFVDELRKKDDVQDAFTAAKPLVEDQVHTVVSAEKHQSITQTPQAMYLPASANIRF